jgi:poly(hydroxyalkanoate) depolymerase family esterase
MPAWRATTSGAPLQEEAISADSGRWLESRFRDRRKLSFGARGRRVELDYAIYLPSGCSRRERLPLMVLLHGCRQSASEFAAGTRMNALADQQRFIVLYPQQEQGANALRCWNWSDAATLEGHGEAGLIAHLVQAIADRYPVDAARIYMAGMSAGGAMVAVLAACHSKLFAAAAIHSGLMYAAASSLTGAARAMRSGSRESPERSAQEAQRISGPPAVFVPTLVIHGDHDTVVHPDNARQIIEQSLALSTTTRLQPPEENATRHADSPRPYQQSDYRANGQLLLRAVTIHGLAHAWSGGDVQYPFNDVGPDSSELIWDFVSQQRRAAARMA